jgi:hypothetical protein
MPTDYRDAAVRHFEDAQLLDVNRRTANADQLFGLSAECALKAVMSGLGMKLRGDGSPQEKGHRVHINNLWMEFVTFAQSRSGAKYAAMLDPMKNPFIDWDVSQRYGHRTDISPNALAVHEAGAEASKSILNAALLDGVVI